MISSIRQKAVFFWAAIGTLSSHAATAEDRLPSLVMTPGREFASSSVVHRVLAPDAPIDPRSDIWVTELLRQIKAYGGASVNIKRYSPPIYIVPAEQPTVRVRAARAWQPRWDWPGLQRQWEAVPLPADFHPASGTDREAIVYQPAKGRYWEFWLMTRTGKDVADTSGRQVPEWRAAWGGSISDLGQSPGYFVMGEDGSKYGTAATGLALLGGLMTIRELRQGTVNHAVHFAIPDTRQWSVWLFPAQRSDGRETRESAIPQGAIFRLPSDLDLDEIDMDPFARIIARAVQRHGMILRDTAGSVVFYAENPGPNATVDPYYGPGGILACPNGRPVAACQPTQSGRLRGFPWDKLQVLKPPSLGLSAAQP